MLCFSACCHDPSVHVGFAYIYMRECEGERLQEREKECFLYLKKSLSTCHTDSDHTTLVATTSRQQAATHTPRGLFVSSLTS